MRETYRQMRGHFDRHFAKYQESFDANVWRRRQKRPPLESRKGNISGGEDKLKTLNLPSKLQHLLTID